MIVHCARSIRHALSIGNRPLLFLHNGCSVPHLSIGDNAQCSIHCTQYSLSCAFNRVPTIPFPIAIVPPSPSLRQTGPLLCLNWTQCSLSFLLDMITLLCLIWYSVTVVYLIQYQCCLFGTVYPLCLLDRAFLLFLLNTISHPLPVKHSAFLLPLLDNPLFLLDTVVPLLCLLCSILWHLLCLYRTHCLLPCHWIQCLLCLLKTVPPPPSLGHSKSCFLFMFPIHQI